MPKLYKSRTGLRVRVPRKKQYIQSGGASTDHGALRCTVQDAAAMLAAVRQACAKRRGMCCEPEALPGNGQPISSWLTGNHIHAQHARRQPTHQPGSTAVRITPAGAAPRSRNAERASRPCRSQRRSNAGAGSPQAPGPQSVCWARWSQPRHSMEGRHPGSPVHVSLHRLRLLLLLHLREGRGEAWLPGRHPVGPAAA